MQKPSISNVYAKNSIKYYEFVTPWNNILFIQIFLIICLVSRSTFTLPLLVILAAIGRAHAAVAVAGCGCGRG
jgi:hypothetical protein